MPCFSPRVMVFPVHVVDDVSSERVVLKANQIRCLEKLQVQKSRCFGALSTDGMLSLLRPCHPTVVLHDRSVYFCLDGY